MSVPLIIKHKPLHECGVCLRGFLHIPNVSITMRHTVMRSCDISYDAGMHSCDISYDAVMHSFDISYDAGTRGLIVRVLMRGFESGSACGEASCETYSISSPDHCTNVKT